MMVLYDKLYRSDNFSSISLRDYIPALLADLFHNPAWRFKPPWQPPIFSSLYSRNTLASPRRSASSISSSRRALPSV